MRSILIGILLLLATSVNAATISKSFSAVGAGPAILLKDGRSFTYSVSGTFSGTVVLEKSNNGGISYSPVTSATTSASGTVYAEQASNKGAFLYRFRCSARASGTIDTSLVEVAGQVKAFRDAKGANVLVINDDGIVVSGNVSASGSILAPALSAPTMTVSSGQRTRFISFQPSSLTAGTSTTPSITTVYVSQIYIPANTTLTGISVSNGATVGTDKYIVALFDATGAAVANSDLAGTLTAGADVYQSVAFTATYAAAGPAVYWVALYVNGTTDRFRTIPAVGAFAGLAGSVTGQTFGTIAALTLPTTFTADKGPVAFVY